MNQMQFDYYYGLEGEQFQFIRIPKLLVQDKVFQGLSDRAKILYGIMLDRMSNSRKHGWLDKQNRVYILFSIKSISEALNCSQPTACKAMAELDSEHGIGLIERRKRGQGKPDIIYVKNFISYVENNPNVGKEKAWDPDDVEDAAEDEEVIEKDDEEVIHNEIKNLNAKNSNSLNSKNLNSRNFISGEQESLSLGIKGFAPNNTELNNTENNNTESCLISSQYLQGEQGKADRTGYDNINPDLLPVIVLDPSKRIIDGDVFDIQYTVRDYKEIPIDWAFDTKKMQLCLQVLSGWNDYLDGFDGFKDKDIQVYLVMLKNLIEMACTLKPMNLGGKRSVTYKNVNDQLNKIYHNAQFPDSCLMGFMKRCVERYQRAYTQTKIVKVDAYCKSVIWSTFDSYSVDWDGYFERTYHGNCED